MTWEQLTSLSDREVLLLLHQRMDTVEGRLHKMERSQEWSAGAKAIVGFLKWGAAWVISIAAVIFAWMRTGGG